jgi:hypothetical protein
MMNRKLFINLSRNMYKHPEYNEMIQRVMSGQELTFANVAGFDTKTMAQTSEETSAAGRTLRAKKKRRFD